MEGAERYPLRSNAALAGCFAMPRQLTMILLYAASREPRRGETPVTRASAVPAAALAWGSSVEYRQQRKSKKAAPQGAVPPRYGAAFSALRQKYGDRPLPLFSRHPFASLFQSSERPAFNLPPYCRVSTKEEDQANSYEVQKEYYTDKIMSNPAWTMAGVFASLAPR